MSDLLHYRAEIDALDDRIIDLLVERIGVCHKVAAWKMKNGVAARLQDRIDAVRETRAEKAAAKGLRADYVRQLYALIIEETCATEERDMAARGFTSEGVAKEKVAA